MKFCTDVSGEEDENLSGTENNGITWNPASGLNLKRMLYTESNANIKNASLYGDYSDRLLRIVYR